MKQTRTSRTCQRNLHQTHVLHIGPCVYSSCFCPSLSFYLNVQDTFRAYCANKPDLDGKSFVKLCKDCEIVDDVFTQIDADLIFAKVVSRGHRRITLHQFELALRMMAQKKGVEEDEIFRRVAESEGVLHAGTQADYVRFFDDKSTYTGTHLYGGQPGKLGEPVLKLLLWKRVVRTFIYIHTCQNLLGYFYGWLQHVAVIGKSVKSSKNIANSPADRS